MVKVIYSKLSTKKLVNSPCPLTHHILEMWYLSVYCIKDFITVKEVMVSLLV